MPSCPPGAVAVANAATGGPARDPCSSTPPAAGRWQDRIATLLDARAVTVCLWHEIALILAVPLIDRFWNVPASEKYLPLESQWFTCGIGRLLIAVFVPLCGGGEDVEDVVAEKRPRPLPG
ncbi:hypothetical protein QFZ63_003609 [Streptomyces sp. B3I7]|nr:hypothetical protein [Streptomyces sp. B3I7]